MATPPLPGPPPRLPPLFSSDDRTARHSLEFFSARRRNPNTRRAYLRALADFSGFCVTRGIHRLEAVSPRDVADWIDGMNGVTSRATTKQRLAAVRGVCDWLVTQRVLQENPASGTHGPTYAPKRGRTPVLAAADTRLLLDSIETHSLVGLRDLCLIALLIYTFSRVGTAIAVRCEDVVVRGGQTWLRLPYRDGAVQEIPCHPELATYLRQFLRAEDRTDGGRLLFRSSIGRTGRLSESPMGQSDVYRMIRRRSESALIGARIGAQSFRATGISHYLTNGGRLDVAQRMANLASVQSAGRYATAPAAPSPADIRQIVIRATPPRG